MRLFSWNLLRRVGARADDVARHIHTHRPDLVLLQEADAELDVLPSLVGGRWTRHLLPNRIHGLAVWSRLPFSAVEILDLPCDPSSRSNDRRFALVLRTPALLVANVHLSHGQILLRRQIAAIGRRLAVESGPAAVIGDFNAFGPTRLDGYRDVGPRRATHAAKGLLPVRLDRCLVRNAQAVSAEALETGASDHKPILVELDIRP